MKIEDDIRSVLSERASSIVPDDEVAWDAFERRGHRKTRSRRVAAGLVATAIAVAAFALVLRAFAPATTVQPSAPPSYSSVDQIIGLLRGGGAGCTHRGVIWGIEKRPVDDSGTCEVQGHGISIYVFDTPDRLARFARPPASPKEWAGISWLEGTNWFIATPSSETAATMQSILGGTILGGTGNTPSVSSSPSSPSTNPLDRPKLKGVQIVPERVVGSSSQDLIVEAPIGEVRWKQNKDCEVTAAPIGGANAGSLGGLCNGGALSANLGGLSVGGVFYDVIGGHAYYGEEVTVRVTYAGGNTTEVTTNNGMWLVVDRPEPELYSPASRVATVEAISPTGQVLDRVKVP